jgi:hypothetical protein
MIPHIHALAQRRNDFWRGLTKIVLVILAGSVALAGLIGWSAVVLVGLIGWRFV